MGLNIAPGLKRKFAAEKWQFFQPEVWDEVRKEAQESINWDVELQLLGGDIDQRMVEKARLNAKKAGVSDYVEFKQLQVKDWKPTKDYGILISNPPYGERMDGEWDVAELYRQMGEIYRPLKTWSKYIITSNEDFEEYYGEKATKKRKIYNGPIRCDFYQYWSTK